MSNKIIGLLKTQDFKSNTWESCTKMRRKLACAIHHLRPGWFCYEKYLIKSLKNENQYYLEINMIYEIFSSCIKWNRHTCSEHTALWKLSSKFVSNCLQNDSRSNTLQRNLTTLCECTNSGEFFLDPCWNFIVFHQAWFLG